MAPVTTILLISYQTVHARVPLFIDADSVVCAHSEYLRAEVTGQSAVEVGCARALVIIDHYDQVQQTRPSKHVPRP